MAARNDESLLFVVEWYDPSPMMKKKYLLKYFVDQHMVEMVDVKTRKMFLRKSACPKEIAPEDFFIGSKLSIYSRELEVVDYGDSKTKNQLHAQVQQCVVVLPPSCYSAWGSAIEALNDDMLLVRVRSVMLSAAQADKLCSTLEISPRNSADLSSGVCLAVVFHGADGFSKVQQIADTFFNTPFFWSGNGQQSSELLGSLLDSPMPSTATYDSCTCCVVKPHAVKGKQLGPILRQIVEQGYEVSAVQSMAFERKQAEEFLQVYKGVVPEFSDHVTQLCAGISVALEVRAQDAVPTFRESAGPWNVEYAKELRPGTLRGRFGVDGVRNAVHCTDLPQDAALECEYCFRIMA